MPMQMGWRWYGEDNDPITLSDIKPVSYTHLDVYKRQPIRPGVSLLP